MWALIRLAEPVLNALANCAEVAMYLYIETGRTAPLTSVLALKALARLKRYEIAKRSEVTISYI